MHPSQSPSPSDDTTERLIKLRGADGAPRVTVGEIDKLMGRVIYKVAYNDNSPGEDDTSTFVHAYLDGTFYLASGHSGCVDLRNFNEEIGVKIAKDRAEQAARDKLWELVGWQLWCELQGRKLAETIATD